MSISRAGKPNVFAWLEEVRARPGMFIGAVEEPLRELETMLHGYYSSLYLHGIVESVPNMSHHFLTWLGCDTRWPTSCGWAAAFRDHLRGKDPLAEFFRYVDRYKMLTPELRFSVTRRARPSSAAPTRVDIVRYASTRLHFLRLWHGTRTRDEWILMDTKGNHQTSLAFAKRSLKEKFLVPTLLRS